MTDWSLAVEGAGLEVVKNRLDAHYKTFKKLQNLVKQVVPRLFCSFFDIR